MITITIYIFSANFFFPLLQWVFERWKKLLLLFSQLHLKKSLTESLLKKLWLNTECEKEVFPEIKPISWKTNIWFIKNTWIFPRLSLYIIPPIGLSMDLRNTRRFLIRFSAKLMIRKVVKPLKRLHIFTTLQFLKFSSK